MSFKMTYLVCIFLAAYISLVLGNIKCVPKEFQEGMACVCNATYCDNFDPIYDGDIPRGQFVHFVSTKGGKRMERTVYTAGNDTYIGTRTAEFTLDRNQKYQKIMRFGAAFTDAGGINLNRLRDEVDRKFPDVVLKSYFADDGLQYKIMRIPIGGADFSDRAYSLCDEDKCDPHSENPLENFSLERDDYDYKIHYFKEAKKINDDIILFASPWSPPVWMKDPPTWNGMTQLKHEHYETYTDYLIRFLEEYRKADVEFWGLTLQNEPTHGLLIPAGWNGMGMNATVQRDLILSLGPKLQKFGDIDLIIMDQRFSIQSYSRKILWDEEAAKYVKGIGVHWYANTYTAAFPLDVTNAEFPDFYIINTEACVGWFPFATPVVLGAWERGELYSHNIIEDLNHWVRGWVEWNLILDMEGGPNWASNAVDAPIIADFAEKVIYKQPMYYVLAHFTRFIVEGSQRIHRSGWQAGGLEILTVERPDGKIVVEVYNPNNHIVQFKLKDSAGGWFGMPIEARSMNTFVYNDLTTGPPTQRPTQRPPSGNNNSHATLIKPFTFLLLVAAIYLMLF